LTRDITAKIETQFGGEIWQVSCGYEKYVSPRIGDEVIGLTL